MRRRRKRRPDRPRRNLLEKLEPRHLLAANPFGTNPLQPFDVTRDGIVSALDALVVINAIGQSDNRGFADPEDNIGNFIDVNGSGDGTALDALNIINALGRKEPLIAAALPNDSAPADRVDLTHDLLTNDYALNLNISAGELGDETISIRIGDQEEPFIDITDEFVDGAASLTADDIDTLFGSPLTDGDHEVEVKVGDGGNAIQFVVTVDRQAPQPQPTVGDIVRVAPDQLDVDFGEPIATTDIDTSAFTLRRTGGDAVAVTSTEPIAGGVRLNLPARLDDAEFELTFDGTVADRAGNVATTATRSFTVADPTGITDISPNVGERQVRVSRDVMIDLDEPIDPSTFSADVLMIKAAGTLVEGNARLSSDARRIIFTPDEPLPRATAITVAINGDQLMGADGLMFDADGDNEPGGSHRVSFQTSTLNVMPGTSISGFIYDSIRTRPNEPLPIPVPAGDPLFDPMNTGSQTIDFTRAKFQLGTGTSIDNPRMHVNLASSFIDAGMVYGDDEFRAKALRRMDGSGKLKSSDGPDGELLPINNAESFPDGPVEVENRGQFSDNELFVAGDIRAAENPQLVSLHTILLREHNRKADEIAAANPRLPGNQIYEQARAWVTALIQHISYQEFLPALVGPGAISDYSGYRSDVDPSIEAMFNTAAFRFGHSMASSSVARLDADGNSLPGGPIAFRDAFFTPEPITDDGLEPYLRGMVGTLTSELDTKVNSDLRNFLFGPPGAGGLDLVALNIARGRDLGLADYNQARVDFGLAPVTGFDEMTNDTQLATALRDTYGSVDQIDPWVGGLAETPVEGAIVGPLFAAVIADQFTRLRDADRFWYQNGRFSTEEVAAIESTRLSTLIERNTGIRGLPAAAMRPGSSLPDAPAGGTTGTTSTSDFAVPGGFGNNVDNPLLGNSNRSLRRSDPLGYADGISQPAGADRPNPRTISNAIFNEDSPTENQNGLTHLFLIWGQFLDHDLSKTPAQDTSAPLNVPVENLTIRVDGLPHVSTTTDVNGFFLLEDVPAGMFFVDFDTSTVTSASEGFGYASTDKPFETLPGRPNAVKEDGKTFDIFLPSFPLDEAVQVTPGEMTVATFGERSLEVLGELHPNIPAEVWETQFRVDVPADTLFMDDGSPAEEFQVFALDPKRIPAPLPEGLDPSIVFSLSADGANDFGTTAQLTFPNLDGLAPGEVRPIWTFDHDAGEWLITGRTVVSNDGSVLVTDEGGVTTLGWKAPARDPLPPIDGLPGGPPPPSPENSGNDDPRVACVNSLRENRRKTLRDAAGIALDAPKLIGGAKAAASVVNGTLNRTLSKALGVKKAIDFSNALDRTFDRFEDLEARGDDISENCSDLLSPRQKQPIPRDPKDGSSDPIEDNPTEPRRTRPEVRAYVHRSQNTASRRSSPVTRSVRSGGSVIITIVNKIDEEDEKLGLTDAEIDRLAEEADRIAEELAGEIETEGFVADVTEFARSLAELAWVYWNQSDVSNPFVGSDSVFFLATNENGFSQRGVVENGQDWCIHFPQGDTVVEIVDAGNDLYAMFQINRIANEGIDLGILPTTTIPEGPDSDEDGLNDLVERILGTNPLSVDTDGDGLRDLAEIEQGLSPLDGIGYPTGVISSVPALGEAKDLAVGVTLSDASREYSFFASGTHGFAIADISNFIAPELVSELELSGKATGVTYDASTATAIVSAQSAGLHFIDVSDPLAPVLTRTVSELGAISKVEMVDGLVAAAGRSIWMLDPVSGEVLHEIELSDSAGRVTDLFQSGATLFAISGNSRLHSIALDGFGGTPIDSIDIPNPPLSRANAVDMQLFVADGVAYVSNGVQTDQVPASNPAARRGGYKTFDVSDPANLSLISDLELEDMGNNRTGNLHTVLNGSGLALVAAGSTLGLQVHDAADPSDTYTPLNRFDTPGTAEAVAVVGGIAFVADGPAGLQVINYRDFDALGIAPTVTINSDALDADPATDGTQVEEGTTVRITPRITDDVQVRSAELIVDGVVTETDLSYPYDFAVIAPALVTGQTSIDIQVRATDTGGNSSTSDPIRLSIIEDITPPEIHRITPVGATLLGTQSVTVSLNEPIDTSRITFSAVDVIDRNDTDISLQPIGFSSLSDDRIIIFRMSQPFELGEYKVRLNESVFTDRAGNALGDQIREIDFNVVEATAVWANPAGGSWHDPANWQSGLVPGADDTVFIEAGSSASITISQEVVVETLKTKNRIDVVSGGDLAADRVEILGGMVNFDGGSLNRAIVDDLRPADEVIENRFPVQVTRAQFTNVVLNADTRIKAVDVIDFRVPGLQVFNGLTLNGTMKVGESRTVLPTGVFFVGVQSVDGDGIIEIVEYGAQSLFAGNHNGIVSTDGGPGGIAEVTLGPEIEITGNGAVGLDELAQIGIGGGTVVSQGLVRLQPGESLSIASNSTLVVDRYAVSIAGTAEEDYGKIIGPGNLELSTIAVDFQDGLVPSINDQFAVVNVGNSADGPVTLEGNEIGDIRLDAVVDDDLITLIARNL